MTRQRLLLVVWVYLVLGLAVRAFAGGLLGASAPPAVVVAPHRVDLNRASVAELSVLPGIGRARAEAIVLERVRRGAFASPADLARVDGLGPAAVTALAGMVHCDGADDAQRAR